MANVVSNMKDEPDRSEYKLTYEDMYEGNKTKLIQMIINIVTENILQRQLKE